MERFYCDWERASALYFFMAVILGFSLRYPDVRPGRVSFFAVATAWADPVILWWRMTGGNR